MTSLVALNLDTRILGKCFSVFVIVVGVSEFFRKPKNQPGNSSQQNGSDPQGNENRRGSENSQA